jgi:hypothetical protein
VLRYPRAVRGVRFLLSLSLVACGGEDSPAQHTGPAAPSGDARTIERALAGEIAAETALAEIALSDGFPVQVAGGFLFAHLDDGSGPYAVAGDFDGWTPRPMQLASKLWFVVIDIPDPDGQKYKLADGAGTLAADTWARRYLYDENGEISLVRATAPHLERFPGVGSADVAPRTVRLRVGTGSATHHLYAHDGQNLFDPIAPFGGWKLDQNVADTTLVIGIDNGGVERMDEYTHVSDVIEGQSLGGGGDAYSDFVRDVVRPLVETRHGKPQKTAILGSSLGGLVAFHQVLRDPGAWDFAAALSGTFGWGSIGVNNETLIERWESAPTVSTKLYLDSGGGPGSGCVDADDDGILDDAPDSADNYCETVQLRDVLDASGYVFDENLFHWYEPGALHDEAAWAARVFRPLSIFEAL